jgi:hypothetical protein
MEWWLQLVEIIYKLALPIGGGIGLYLAWRRVTAANQQAEAQTRQAEASARQAELGRHKLVSDLFSQAVGQLGDDKLEIRLLAIYTLRRIAAEFPDFGRAVLELLTAYVRTNANKWGDADPPLDVQEIFKVLESSIGSDP